MSDDEQRAVRAIVAAAQAVDGVEPLGEAPMSALGSTAPAVTHLLAVADGEIRGYASVLPGRDGEPAMAEAVVVPAAREHGIGTELIRRALATADGSCRVWAHGDLPAARAVAAHLGLVPRRELLQLRRDVGPGAAPLPPLPARSDVVLRTYEGTADDAEILRVNNAAFDWHPEQGGWTVDQIAERTGAGWFDPAGVFVAVDAGSQRLLGFHWTKVHGPDLGEVYIVGVDPDAQGRGLGNHLTLAGLHYLAERVPTVNLYVEGDNTAALRTYEGLGFERYRADVAYGRSGEGNEG
nr:mycothiol synthase [Gordonia araii]